MLCSQEKRDKFIGSAWYTEKYISTVHSPYILMFIRKPCLRGYVRTDSIDFCLFLEIKTLHILVLV